VVLWVICLLLKEERLWLFDTVWFAEFLQGDVIAARGRCYCDVSDCINCE
jgi:hypothetical protein